MKTEFYDHRETSEHASHKWTPEAALEKGRDTISSQEDFLHHLEHELAKAQTRDREIKRRFEAEHEAIRREVPMKNLLEARHKAMQDRKADEARSFYAHEYKKPEDPITQSEDGYSSEGEYADELPSHLSMRRGARLEGVWQPGLRRREIPNDLRHPPIRNPGQEYNRRMDVAQNQYNQRIAILDEQYKEEQIGGDEYKKETAEAIKEKENAESAVELAFPKWLMDRQQKQLDAYRDAREIAYGRGRYPAHQPVEWHREERRKEAGWQDRAFDPVMDEDAVLQEQYDLRRHGLHGEVAWNRGESAAEMLARERAERRAELQMRLDALDEELDRAADDDDVATYRTEKDGLEEKTYHRPEVKRRENKNGIVFQHRGPHPEQMPQSKNRENKVPSKGSFAPDRE